MKPRSPLSLSFLSIFSVLLVLPCAAGAFCARESPESVLSCLVDVYETRDIDAYAELFTEDFVFQFGSDPEISWGLDQELEAHRKLFSHPDIIDIKLELHGHDLRDGDEPDTWILTNVSMTLTVMQTHPESGEPMELHSVESDTIFYVKRVTNPEVHYVIYKWISHPNE